MIFCRLMRNTILIAVSCFFLSLASSSYPTAADAVPQPTIAVRLSRSGLDFFSSIGHKIVEKEFPKTEFPPIKIPINDGPGSGTVEVDDLHIPKFQSPHFNFNLSPPDGIFFRSQGGAVKVNGNWMAVYDYLVKLYASGWVEVVASDIQSQLTLGVYGRLGKPQVRVFNCTADVGQIQIEIGGGVIPWVVNLFKADLAVAVKQAVHDQFCITTRQLLEQQLNEALRTLPDRIEITNSVFVNYVYTSNPRTTSDYLEGDVYADVMLQNRSCSLLPSPNPLRTPAPTDDYMMNAWVSQRVVNCLLESLHNSGQLQFVIDKNMDARRFSTFLKTECRFYQLCMGRFFPKLSSKYPDSYVDFVIYSASPPTVAIVSGGGLNAGVKLQSQFFLDVHLSPWKEHGEVLARLAVTGNSTINPAIFNDRIGGITNETQIEFVEVFSTIGTFSSGFLNALDVLLKPVIRVAADTSLRVGLPIPMVEGIKLANRGRIVTLDEEVRVDADLSYITDRNSPLTIVRMNGNA